MDKGVIKAKQVLPVLMSAAALSSFGLTGAAHAQGSGQSTGLEEIIVTAQKRAQSVQDVPIAVTAVTQEMIETNRIFTVNDLSGMAPNMVVRPAAGGVSLPAFSMRGITSYGVVPGSDKQVSMYLDGVYLGNPRGSIFTLPDIIQLEVLRGPQGTLFGRNATAGAISVVTRDPQGELGFKQVLDFGNNDHFRSRTTFDTPSWNGLSAYVTYLKEERDGDVKNLGAGTFWDRRGFGKGTATSPDTLRETDIETWFAAVNWEPNDTVLVTYKYDYAEDNGSPDVQSLISFEPEGLGGFEPLMLGIAAANPDLTPTFPKVTRPKEANNAFHIPRSQENEGHNLTAAWEINDKWVAKTILAYRKMELFAISDISGTSGWIVGPIGAVLPNIPGVLEGPYPPDTRYCYFCSNSDSESEQTSAELQFNYDSDFAALTFGALYYDSEDESGSPVNSAGTLAVNTGFLATDGTIPTGNEARSFNEATSYAAYVQGEFHVTDNLDLVLGYRLNRDEKSGFFRAGEPGDYDVRKFDYDDTDASYTLGINYTLNDDILLYGKYDSSFVSGGSTAGLDYDPEEVESFELGLKSDYLDGRLRANVALFYTEYDKRQTAQGSTNVPGYEGTGTLVVEGGDMEAKGVELELYALPLEGLRLGLTLGYVDTEYTRVTDLLMASVDGREGDLYPTDEFRNSLNPEWSGNINASYVTQPLFNDAYMSFSVTGIWRDDMLLSPNEVKSKATAAYRATEYSPSTWMVNAHMALREIRMGNWTGEIALWGRNLADDDEITFALQAAGAVVGAYAEERTYGISFTVEY